MTAQIAETPIIAQTSILTKSETNQINHNLILTTDQIIECTAEILEDMITERGAKYTSKEEIPTVTPFHSQKLPSISLKDYLKRFAQFSNCDSSVFVLAMIFLDRIGENLPDFQLDSFNVLRTILLSLVAAIKSQGDYYYKNSYYSKIGGLPVKEFNDLEVEFLMDYIQFQLYVDTETYNSYYQDLVNFHQDKANAEEEH